MFARLENATLACKVFTVQITDLESILVAKAMSGNLPFVQIVMVCKCVYDCKVFNVHITDLASILVAKVMSGNLLFVQIVMVCKYVI